MSLKGLKIGLLGGGAMAEALLAGLLKSKSVDERYLFVSEVKEERRKYLRSRFKISVSEDNVAVAEKSDILLLAVKPHAIKEVVNETRDVLHPGQTVISIAAGITTSFIEDLLKKPVAVVRVMPNSPCLVGAGASSISPGLNAGPEDLTRAFMIFNCVGRVVEVPENLVDIVTGLSGSGPAYMFLILEAFIDGAVRLGLPRDMASVLSAQTMLGSAKMFLDTCEHTGKLRDMVVTPGGTTAAGLFALESGGVRHTLMKAVEEAARKSKNIL